MFQRTYRSLHDLLRMSSFNADDLVILSAPGYSKVVMFHDNARATPNDDDGEDNIDAALNEGRGGYHRVRTEYLYMEYLHVYYC